MDGNSVGQWFRRYFRETPWTAWLVSLNLLTWLLAFFRFPELATTLTGELGIQTAWVWLTYPLYTPHAVHWLLLLLYVFHWISSSLERTWGSEKFARVFVVVTLLSALGLWLGRAIEFQSLSPRVDMTPMGIGLPLITIFMLWGALNSGATVLAFFVIPVRAKYLAWAATAISYFSLAGYYGLIGPGFVVAVAGLGWSWARRGTIRPAKSVRKTISERFEERKRARRKSRFKVVEGSSNPLPEARVPDLKALKTEPVAPQKTVDEAELDRILDKIRFEGMAALTAEEKETLDSQSKKLNEQ